MKIFEWSSKHIRAVVLLVAGLALVGALTAINLPVAIFPNLTIPRIIIAAEGGDAPADSILVSVTKPIEAAVSTVPGLVLVSSQTTRGSAGFTLTFTDGTDMAATLQQVQARITELQPTFPSGVHVVSERLNASVFPILDYSITSKSQSLANLRTLTLNTIRPRIARVPGVAKVLVNGGDVAEMIVTIRPDRLASYGIPLSTVEDAINKANTVAATGSYESQYVRQLVLVSGLLTDAESVKQVVVTVKNRVPVKVGDLADVRQGIQRKTVIATGGGREAVLMNIVRQPDGNTVQVADGVDQEIRSLKAALPADVQITPFYDQSLIVKESSASVIESIAVGGALAIFVVAVFLRNLRSAVVALSLLPLTVLSSFVALRLLGLSLNIMTLGAMAIALGLVVDDSIVVVEHIFKKLESGLSRKDSVREGLHEITPAMFSSSLATIVVFLPLNLMPGVTGNFFAPLAKTMIATLIISLALALTVVPLLAAALFPKVHKLRGETKAADDRGLGKIYGSFLAFGLRYRWWFALSIIPLGYFTAMLYSNLTTGFMPEFDEGAFVVDYKMPPGTSLTETNRVMVGVEDILSKADGVQTWSRLTGALSGSGLEITPLNQGDILVRLKEGKRPAADDIMTDVRNSIQQAVPNIQVDLKQILGDLIGDLAGAPSPVEVKVFGPDINKLRDIAHTVGQAITADKHVVDENDGITESGPEAVVHVDPVRAAEMGFSTDSVTTATEGALDGHLVGSIRKGELLVPIRVMYPFNRQSSAEQLSKMPIVNAAGQAVPVEEVGTVQIQPGSPELDRENQRQMVSVTARLEGEDLGTGIKGVQAKLAKIALPPGYSFELGGLYKSQQESFSALLNVLISASALVFIVLLFTFRSYRMASALFIAAILALTGVIAALYLTGTPLNISSYTGAIMIVGIVTENGVLLFDEFRRLHHEFPEGDTRQLLIQAGQARLRPILMTTFAAILALFPLALGLGAGAAMQKPLAIAVIGGLTLSMLFTLVFAPVLYGALDSVKRKVVRSDRKSAAVPASP